LNEDAMKTLRRAALPLTVLISVLCLHFLWYTRWGPHVGWVSLGPTASPSPLRRYLESQSVWLGASYALSLVAHTCCWRCLMTVKSATSTFLLSWY
jgi:hypothetical protein